MTITPNRGSSNPARFAGNNSMYICMLTYMSEIPHHSQLDVSNTLFDIHPLNSIFFLSFHSRYYVLIMTKKALCIGISYEDAFEDHPESILHGTFRDVDNFSSLLVGKTAFLDFCVVYLGLCFDQTCRDFWV